MKDRVVQHPHRYQLMPVAGQEGYFDIMAAPGTVTEAGTPINKASLLTDDTAALYGLSGEDATVDVALSEALAKPLADRRKCARLSGGSSISTSGGYVSFSTNEVDDYGAINMSQPTRITIPSGVSHVRFSIYIHEMLGRYNYLELYRNGSLLERIAQNGQASTNFAVCGWKHTNVVPVSADQYFQVYFRNPESGQLGAGTKFQMEVI